MYKPMPNVTSAASVRRALLGSVSLLPLAFSAIYARPAHATSCSSPVTVACTTLSVSGNGNLTVTSTGIITGGEAVDNGSYTVGTLGNEGGRIDGTSVGVYNEANGTIDLLNNQAGGSISGGGSAVLNFGVMGQLTNAGTLTGANGFRNVGGIYDTSPTLIAPGLLGTLTNTGTIDATGQGIDNEGGSITLLNNAARIAAGASGVNNDGGDILTLSNSGTLTGAVGVRNFSGVFTTSPTTQSAPGIIGTLANTGTINATQEAVYNDGGTVALVNNVAVMSAGDTAIYNVANGEILTLLNSGTISGAVRGIGQDIGTIISLGNSGVISGGFEAIDEYDSQLEMLTNTGTMIGGSRGVFNDASTIGTFANASPTALISGGTDGILNEGTISTLVNAGTITATLAAGDGQYGAAVVGIENGNGDTIGLLSNLATGAISGASSGIYNLGTIVALNNSGVITGGSSGIDNEGQINTLANSGTINGGSSGIDNEGGTISLLTNTGTILGPTGILNTYNRGNSSLLGMIGELDNNGLISSIVNDDMIGGGATAVANQYLGVIFTLDNQAGGLITGVNTAVDNFGTIGLLSNEGTITGNKGIDNYGGVFGPSSSLYAPGQITTLTNTGAIVGSSLGVVNANGTINLLDNASSIAGGTAGIDNYGEILTLTNSGTLSGDYEALLNDGGTIVSLYNSGTISGDLRGINSAGGEINTLTNSGTIIAAYFGVYNPGGTIAALDNQAGGLISGGYSGIYNEATIDVLSNEGTITGGSGIDSVGDIGTLINGGVIRGTGYGLDSGVGTIGAVENSGTITGGQYGIANVGYTGGEQYAAITVLANAGTISGGVAGYFDNTFGSIGTLDNAASAVISGPVDGVSNQGIIGTLINDGTFIATNPYETHPPGVIDAGLFNDSGANIAALTNDVTGLILSGSSAVLNAGSIGVLTNAGTIDGLSSDGVENEGGIGTLINAAGATIFGGATGVFDGGAIGTLINHGSIIGGDSTGISVSRAELGGLTNTGLITGKYFGIDNGSGSIGLIENSGTIISTESSAIDNAAGSIGALINSGVVVGGPSAIDNTGTIALLANTGTITGTNYGVNNELGTIGIFENTGLITGGSIAGIIMATGTLQNAGTIAGPTGIILTGDNASVFDSGTIASTDGGDAIKFEAPDPDSLTLTTGADILGAIDGGTTAGSITLEGTGTLNTSIINFATGSALDVVSGADWAGAGNWTIATLTNDGQFQGGLIGTPLTLRGDFIQTRDGTLLVAVTPGGESRFTVDGTANIAGGLKYAFAPGTYRAGTYEFLTASGGIAGSFATAAYLGAVPKAFTHSTLQDLSTGNLVLTAATVTQGAPPPVVGVVAPADDAVFADANEAAALSAQSVNQSLLGKAAEGSAAAADAAACASQAAGVNATGNGPNVSNDARLAATIGQAFCAAGGWVQATGGVATQNGAEGFTANMAGFLAGVDAPFDSTGTRLGLAVGYDEDWLKDGAAGRASIGTARIGLYGSQPLGRAILAADVMLGTMNDNTARQTGLGEAQAKPNGTVFEAGLQAATSLTWNGFALTPAAGLRLAVVHSTAFGETTPAKFSAFAVTGAATSYDSVQPYANITFSHTYFTGNALAITPEISAGYAAELADRGKSVNVTAPDGTIFASFKPSQDSSAAAFSAGLSAGQGAWSLYAQYNAAVAGNWNAQTGEAGIEAKF